MHPILIGRSSSQRRSRLICSQRCSCPTAARLQDTGSRKTWALLWVHLLGIICGQFSLLSCPFVTQSLNSRTRNLLHDLAQRLRGIIGGPLPSYEVFLCTLHQMLISMKGAGEQHVCRSNQERHATGISVRRNRNCAGGFWKQVQTSRALSTDSIFLLSNGFSALRCFILCCVLWDGCEAGAN